MDHLKFAQYCNMPSGHKKDRKRLELMEEIDVHYCIPYTPPKMRHWPHYSPGYTFLHVAAEESDINLVHELIKRGADVLKQEQEKGLSPIHVALQQILSTDGCMRKDSNGDHSNKINKLIDALLSVHITTKNTINPRSKDGLSHFHIACIVDHIEAVEFFLKAGESVDQTIVSTAQLFKGYTPLHLSIQFLATKTTEILLAHGADIYLKDCKSTSPVHLLIERLIKLNDLATMGKRTLRCNYEKDMEKCESMINLILKTRMTDDVNFSDDIGFTAFHVACMSKDKSIVEDFLTKGADIDKAVNNKSKLWPGWTPLHFAACSSIEILKYLVKNGANVIAKDAQGKTPLDFCIMRYAPKILHSIFLETGELNNIVLSDGSTKFSDLLIAMNDRDSFEEFLQNLSDVKLNVAIDSPIWPGYSLLHLCVIMNEKKTKEPDLFSEYCKVDIHHDTYPPEDYNYSESEETIYMERMEMCVRQGCSVSIKNAEGLSPIHLAFKLLKRTALEFLLSHCEEDATDPDGWSHLHIACAKNKSNTDLVKKLLNKGSNVNSSVKQTFNIPLALAGIMKSIGIFFKRGFNAIPSSCEVSIRAQSTPLHIAVLMGNKAMVEYLLQAGADVHAKDDLERSPIHVSIEVIHFDPTIIARLLIRASPVLTNSISRNGVSLLHVAAFANEPQVVDKLLREGARANQKIESDSASAGETPLHLAIRLESIVAAITLIMGGADVHTVHLTKKFSSPLQYAANNYDDSHIVMRCIIKKLTADEYGVGAIDESGVTLLHLACVVGDYSLAKELLERGADPNAQIRDDEEYEGNWKGLRPLHLLIYETATAGIPKSLTQLTLLLLNYGADVTMNKLYFDYDTETEEEETLLLAARELLLKSQKSYDVNPTDDQGISHFHYAASIGDLDVMKKFLDSGIDINEMINPFATENAGQTPLHFASYHCQMEAVLFLIEHGADVKAQDAKGDTPLHALLESSVDLELIDVFLKAGADINAKNLLSTTPVGNFLDRHGNALTVDVVKFFLSRGYKIAGELNDGFIGEIMIKANLDEFQLIFKTLIEACDLKNAIKNGFHAITSLVSNIQGDQITLEYYLETIESLMEMGCDIDWKCEEGETALQKAADRFNANAVKALLLLGTDINKADIGSDLVYSVDELIDLPFFTPKISVTEALADHIWKMKLANLSVRGRFDDAGDNPRGFERRFPLGDDKKQRFLHELTEMQNTHICKFLTVDNFMSDLGAVASYSHMLAEQKEAVDKFFNCRADLRKDFPEYCGLLLIQYKKLLARIELLQPARDAFVRLCPTIELPHLCIEAVLRYLKNDELKNLSNV